MNDNLAEAAEILLAAETAIAFTGAGISVESGIPPFRGKDGIWNKYDPMYIEYDFFIDNPEASWKVIKEIFFDSMLNAQPNDAHLALAELERLNIIDTIITQNIDNLHQEAGSDNVLEFHGNTKYLRCLKCYDIHFVDNVILSKIPPYCPDCGGILKPDFIFFGEMIPEEAGGKSLAAAKKSEAVLCIGTTGEVMPATMIPQIAKNNGAKIIEINTEPTMLTANLTDIFLQGKASEVLPKLTKIISEKGSKE